MSQPPLHVLADRFVAELKEVTQSRPNRAWDRPLVRGLDYYKTPISILNNHIWKLCRASNSTPGEIGIVCDEIIAAARTEDPLALVHRLCDVDVFAGFADIEAMVGLRMTSVTGAEQGSEKITFCAEDGRVFNFYHSQDCCESVSVEQVDGDPNDLVGTPIVMAEEVDNLDAPPVSSESFTWTFYKFATNKGYVTVRWLGVSNGYYSEGVSLNVTLDKPADPVVD